MIKNKTDLTFTEFQTACVTRMCESLPQDVADIPSLELRTATEYVLSNHGKFVRPMLVYAAGLTFGADWTVLDLPARAVELIHTYSLVHDDLPCMDNSDLRRGKPTCHKAFSESTATLVGDGLQSLAFEILSTPSAIAPARQLEMVKQLSHAAGPFGMVSGQVMDLNLLTDKNLSNDLLLETFKLKTGAIIAASVYLGWLASNDTNEINEQTMITFGHKLGLAFQIQDDVLDVIGHQRTLGKPQYLDKENGKITYVTLHGLDKAKKDASNLHEDALEALNYLGREAGYLRELTNHLLLRSY